MIKLKRVYEEPSRRDGERILVERLWPRGITKERARLDLWLKEVAPSPQLRKWFAHDPSRWSEFQRRYESELNQKKELIQVLKQKAKAGTVTFVFSAHESELSCAVVLKRIVEQS